MCCTSLLRPPGLATDLMRKGVVGRIQASMLLVMGSKSSGQAIRRLQLQLFVTSVLSYKKINGV